MTRRITLTLLILVGLTLAVPLPLLWSANTNLDYTGTPPYVSGSTPPNILLYYQTGGQLNLHSYGTYACGVTADDNTIGNTWQLPNLGWPCGTNFDETQTYVGAADSLTCYQYSAANGRFEPSSVKAVDVTSQCGATEWDGNLLNWMWTTKFEMIRLAMSGGACAVARDVNGNCPPIGVPPLVTMWPAHHPHFGNGSPGAGQRGPLPVGNGPGLSRGRVPVALEAGAQTYVAPLYGGPIQCTGQSYPFSPDPPVPGPCYPNYTQYLYFQTSEWRGTFCVNDNYETSGSYCADTNSLPVPGPDPYVETFYQTQIAYGTEPTGLLQAIGTNARWGLQEPEFQGGAVAPVLVPIGYPQFLAPSSNPLDTTTKVLTTYSSNLTAMLAAFDATEISNPGPQFANSLYEAARYVAQLPNPANLSGDARDYTSMYFYPIAFPSGSTAFGVSGPGSLGPGELAVQAPNLCLAGYLAQACGRDPFFQGTTSNPNTVSNCCQTYVVFLTDGMNSPEINPASLKDYAHAIHGPHCTGPGVPPFPGTCGYNWLDDPLTVFTAHKHLNYTSPGGAYTWHSLDDIAYWAHTTDLRPDNGNSDATKACNSTYGAIPNIAILNVAGNCVKGMQNITLYVLNALGNDPLVQQNSVGAINQRGILYEAARQGGFVDSNSNGLPDLQAEWDSINNDTGAPGGDGIPDTYYESNDSSQMAAKLASLFTNLLKKAAAGTAIGVLSTSSSGEGAVYEAYFFPSDPDNNQVSWVGYLQGLFLDRFGNLREDFSAPGCTGAPDGKLIYKHDCIVKLRYDASSGAVKVDRFQDADGDGVADTVLPFETVDLKDVQAIWEGGRRLALTTPGANCAANTGGATCRRILTWADVSNDGAVDAAERLEFTVANESTLCPFLGGSLVANCVSGTPAQKAASQTEATNIINFIRGNAVAGLRSRSRQILDDTSTAVTKVWPLGDIMSSSPVSVGAPSERFDALYGDVDYSTFFARYKDRRQVIYTGANDGMLHAFNAGYFAPGDVISTPDVEELRFTTTPKQPGTNTNCASLPCDGSVATYAYRGVQPPLGAELWAFIPQDLLPQLRWLTDPAYSHIYYVDQKPKVTDARIFTADADHPGGWGTILIGGFRFGGSCRNCTNKGIPRVVNADFDGGGLKNRIFLSSYFVLDITNPEKDPVLLWTFRDQDLGLTTAQPAVVRIKPTNTLADPKTASTNEKWFMIVGTGPTNFDADSSQAAKLFAVDMKLGPTYLPNEVNKTNGSLHGSACSAAVPCTAADPHGDAFGTTTAFPTGLTGAFMGDAASLDYDLDFRVDVIYAGSVTCTGGTAVPCNGVGPAYKGAMWRLLTNGNTNPDNWGVRSGPNQIPTTLISTFTCVDTTATCATKVGPVTARPTLSTDDTHNIWVFFGTGRYYSNADKTNQDPQKFLGVKDCIITGLCIDQTIEQHNLLDVSNVVICTSCVPSASVSLDGGATFTVGFNGGAGNLVNNIQNMDGWVTNLPNVRERNLSPPTLLGGTLFFTTFITSADPCVAGGNGLLYALYYGTGTPFSDSMIGTSVSGGNTIANSSLALGVGMPSQAAVQIGAQGTGAHGSTSNAGCIGQVTAFVQAGTGAINQFCAKPALSPWSRLLSWRDL